MVKKPLPLDDEGATSFALRRHAEWTNMVDTPGWSDFSDMVRRSRDGVVRDLVAGLPNRYGERGDDEKRAMIHAFNIILRMYDDVVHDANTALKIVRECEARR